jgi:hypothetical protein
MIRNQHRAMADARNVIRWQGRQAIIDHEPRLRTGMDAPVSAFASKGTTT